MADSRILERLNLDELPVRVEQVRQIQLERLQATLHRAARTVSYYHDLFRSLDLLPQDIGTLEELRKLPLTERSTLLERQPYGMLAVPPRDVVRIHTALGPCGHPIVVASTENDLRHWTLLTARALSRVRVSRDDTVYIGLDYGQSVAAFGMQYGAEAIGATVIPRSHIVLREQVAVMKNYRVSVLVCTPSFARRLVHFLEAEQYDVKSLFLRSLVLVAEPSTRTTRQQLAERLFVNVYEAYGLDEIFNPGIAAQEAGYEGLLVNEDHFIVEVIDPASGAVVPEGRPGEMVITTLSKEAMPLVRYRTAEMACLKRVTLDGGRQVLQLEPLGQRTDELIYAGGSKFYPQQVGELLSAELRGVHRYSVVITPQDSGDHVELQVEVTPEVFAGEMVALTVLKDRLESELYLKFAVPFHYRWVEKDALRGMPLIQDERWESKD